MSGTVLGRVGCRVVALDFGGYAVTFAVSQLSHLLTVCSICSQDNQRLCGQAEYGHGVVQLHPPWRPDVE